MGIFSELLDQFSNNNSLIGQNAANPYAQSQMPWKGQAEDQVGMAGVSQGESLATLLGAQGGGNRSFATPNTQQVQAPDMSQYSSVNGILNTLNGMKARSGQPAYENFISNQGVQNPYIQQLLQRGK